MGIKQVCGYVSRMSSKKKGSRILRRFKPQIHGRCPEQHSPRHPRVYSASRYGVEVNRRTMENCL